MAESTVRLPRPLRAPRGNRRFWLAAGATLAGGTALVLVALNLLLGAPEPLAAWIWVSLAPLAIAVGCVLVPAFDQAGPAVLRSSVLAASIGVLVVAVYVTVVIGLGQPVAPADHGLLGLSMIAAAVVAVLVLPLRSSLADFSRRITAKAKGQPADIFGRLQARMTRAVPMDELLLSLAEQLREGLGCESVEIYTGASGELSLAVAVPDASRPALSLSVDERSVIGRTRMGAAKWAAVWLPGLVTSEQTLRIAPLTHQGEVLGLIVVRRAPESAFTEEEERLLAELARQFGLALHNVHLDSALQRSLVELEERNSELRASRLRIVASGNETRRTIERNLHDGAQQHLVALAVKIGLVEQIYSSGDVDAATKMLGELRGDVRAAVQEVRELAHGIYPPLLRDKGLPEALRAAATRSPLEVGVVAEASRHTPDIEAAVYFCCVEALQNAGKYAGPGAEVTVKVTEQDSRLRFEVRDTGTGFDADDETIARGNGFTNMLDRLGALGGTLTVTSRPGDGTSVVGSIPLPDPEDAELERAR
jgi:signal transduction histidine kinase